MKTTILLNFQKITSTYLPVVMIIIASASYKSASAQQNLIVNPGFSNGTNGWNTECSIEINPETVYGGSVSSNPVSEIDIERCLNQEVIVAAGNKYNFSYIAGRRQGGTPATVGVTLTITGVQSGTQYVQVNHTYTNTTWSYTTQNLSFTIPAHSADTKVNVKFVNYLTTGTYGTLIDDITLKMDPISLVLPVKLKNFTGEMKNGQAILNWVAANDDQDGRYFIVERAEKNGSFDSVGTVAVALVGGNISYSFADKKIPANMYHYRLKIVNAAGHTYSKIISLESKAAVSVQVFPNPATSAIGFRLSSSVKASAAVQVFNVSGAMVISKTQQLNTGMNAGNIDVTALPSGSFFLMITDSSGMKYVQSFCKK